MLAGAAASTGAGAEVDTIAGGAAAGWSAPGTFTTVGAGAEWTAEAGGTTVVAAPPAAAVVAAVETGGCTAVSPRLGFGGASESVS